ncbi:MAG: tRNA (uridine(34)/cytosine(34)/5-carboxymethylaminomethyluridine(34)-2'-O)-methyltransferase TrmL [cyanobacterium endosymbiont of Epithemia adnata isolate EadnSB Bon19]|jgi:tRNA (cytidine/uridine-2'-O-)-methyltransferase|uniref:tRNA (uridine(34)/cytosine(34)/5- carboxymethylaminomethyluridine(34)-2'-O)- methyltransferase TrmL n=1 Tax=cyanobacterium endosymbiont of Epithemia turgida TaxID=718217 RepID=UPI0004D0D3FA|nr:tRNA (uridine(34)/cytosine(34)/5-carboxymethylaminomethyluridine(34)-2'-O)-methyltransferase TrmL [cyanobacterium endosymbiont of Epithemia turgida]BAP17855.1 tRNA/rRNA methyltransferase [cyanobacterium endosymbiont of Epithemia turgida isolate EtSB Lake Yunoko]
MPRIILFNPQIPPNTGNIARTCAATHTELHLVAPLGFELSNRYLKRAGLDYWPYVNLNYHNSLEDFLDCHKQQGGHLLGFSVRGRRSYLEWIFQDSDWLLFGSETEGLPQSLLANCQETLYIPMSNSQVRSLNLSVSVTIGLFEARRQLKMV